MSISRLTLPASGAANLSAAAERHGRALERVQRSFTPSEEPPRDRVDLSDAARNLAVPEATATSVEVEATAATVRAEDERFAALMFVVSHHGPGLR